MASEYGTRGFAEELTDLQLDAAMAKAGFTEQELRSVWLRRAAKNLLQNERQAVGRRLHRICGYVEAGEGEPLVVCQDDATKGWTVSVGANPLNRQVYRGDTLLAALDVALREANHYHLDAYQMEGL